MALNLGYTTIFDPAGNLRIIPDRLVSTELIAKNISQLLKDNQSLALTYFAGIYGFNVIASGIPTDGEILLLPNNGFLIGEVLDVNASGVTVVVSEEFPETNEQQIARQTFTGLISVYLNRNQKNVEQSRLIASIYGNAFQAILLAYFRFALSGLSDLLTRNSTAFKFDGAVEDAVITQAGIATADTNLRSQGSVFSLGFRLSYNVGIRYN